MKTLQAKNIISYLLRHSYEKKLPTSRLAATIFLVDWKYCLEYGKKIGNLNWRAYSFGPNSEELELLFKKDKDFILLNNDMLMENKVRSTTADISPEEKYCCDFIIEICEHKDIDQLVNFMLSLYPILTSAKDGGQINLLEKSMEYNLLKPDR
ncbi:type II toxin-antitoxin system antitoxin SocA domain-containing protein [Pseudomonas carnis]|uniref:type II toxin-antitoxin system antitoxin SocA domain-containing protein n=1 Tax=Pseudomonas carnis TaxID=2487355 RepID=UPI001BC9B2E1|nr:type II toxin-antitoxin system antitoxin SocA domain-containing protein [Pseudomonas carnis]